MSRRHDSVSRFDGRSADYARYRPSYAPRAIDTVLAGLGEPAHLAVVDVGAGTGISTRLLAERGARVVGLEPNAAMRSEATRLGLDVRDGTVTDNDLPDGAADLATAFQAYHWFATADAARALRRLLRPGGRLALVWNVFDRRDALTDGIASLLDRFAVPEKIAGLGPERAARHASGDGRDAPGAQPGDYIARSLADGGFEEIRTTEVPYAQALDESSLLGRLRSSSSAPTSGPSYDAMAAALHDLVVRLGAGGGAAENVLVHRTRITLATAPVA